MSKKTVLVTGATGFLGRQVVIAFQRANWHTVGTGLSRANPPSILKLDLCDAAAVEATLDQVKPQAIVHCAALRSPDAVETNPTAAHALNVTATAHLSTQCAARSIFLLYISTDYVFAGTPGDAPYTPSSPPSPTNLYGRTKLAGEHALRTACAPGRAAILRVPVLYGPAETPAESAINCLVDVVWAAQQPGAALRMDDWALRCPTNTEDVARVCADVVMRYTRDRRADAPDEEQLLPVVLQFSARERRTKFQVCGVLAEILGLGVHGLVPDRRGDGDDGGQQAGVKRPFDCSMSTGALEEIGVDAYTQDFVGWWRRELRAVRR